MGWKVNLWARLFDGERAYQLIEEQLTPVHEGEGHGGTYLNLLDAHPPFQIDGNFGCTSGIAEMLVQSHDGVIHLLPALPQQWSSGQVTGLKARGGFTIDLEWHNRKVTALKIISTIGGNCRLRTAAPLNDIRLTNSIGVNKNVFFEVSKIKTPIISSAAMLASTSLPMVYEYDLLTEINKTYYFTFSE
jgi:alpha-L-fucosidase 2